MTRPSSIPMLVILLTLVGCAVHEPQSRKEDVFAETYMQQDALASKGQVVTHRWWEMYNDPKLNRLMDRGFAGNLDLAMAWARLEQARALEDISGASQFPDVNGNARTGRSQSIPSVSSYQNHQVSVAASYELDVWQKLANERASASLLRLASENDIKAVYVTLSAQIAEAYYLILELRAKVALNKEILEFFEKTVKLVRLRYERGVVPSLDLYQAKQNLLNARAEMPTFERDLVVAENSLAVLLGFAPRPDELSDLATLPDVEETHATGLPSELLARRPDVEAAYSRLQSTDAEVAVAIAERFPQFTLTADYGSRSTDLADLLQDPNIFWNVLAGVSAPLFDGGRRRANVRHKEAVFQEQLARYHLVVIQAFTDVEDSLARERGADLRYTELLAYKEVTAATLRLSLERYQLGIDTFLPVLTAQASHSKALMAVLTAKRTKISSRIQLARALGGTWMVDEMAKRQDGEGDF